MPDQPMLNVNNKREKAEDLFNLIFLFHWDEETGLQTEKEGKKTENLSSQQLGPEEDARLQGWAR